jgi:hypothetical protein
MTVTALRSFASLLAAEKLVAEQAASRASLIEQLNFEAWSFFGISILDFGILSPTFRAA